MPGHRVEVVVRVPEKIHARLVKMAEDRELALEALCAELLEVAVVEQAAVLRAENFHNRPDPLGQAEP